MLSAVRLLSVCCRSSVSDVGAPYSGGWTFRQFFSPYDSSVTLLFWCQKSLVGDAPFPLKFSFKVTDPFQIAKFRPISAHSASTVIASEKSSIITYRKSTTRFPTSYRWTVYVTPKSPKGWHKKAISLFVPIKFNFSRKKSATKFLCMKTSSGKVVATSFSYPTVYRSIAGDVPIYLKLAFKVTHPFRKRRFPKLSFKSAIGLGAFWSGFSPYDTLAIHWHPQEILRRSSQGNPSIGGI